jgi:hypothetical protein
VNTEQATLNPFFDHPIEADFEAKVESEFAKMIEVIASVKR